jgi:hypothetical protein
VSRLGSFWRGVYLPSFPSTAGGAMRPLLCVIFPCAITRDGRAFRPHRFLRRRFRFSRAGKDQSLHFVFSFTTVTGARNTNFYFGNFLHLVFYRERWDAHDDRPAHGIFPDLSPGTDLDRRAVINFQGSGARDGALPEPLITDHHSASRSRSHSRRHTRPRSRDGYGSKGRRRHRRQRDRRRHLEAATRPPPPPLEATGSRCAQHRFLLISPGPSREREQRQPRTPVSRGARAL